MYGGIVTLIPSSVYRVSGVELFGCTIKDRVDPWPGIVRVSWDFGPLMVTCCSFSMVLPYGWCVIWYFGDLVRVPGYYRLFIGRFGGIFGRECGPLFVKCVTSWP